MSEPAMNEKTVEEPSVERPSTAPATEKEVSPQYTEKDHSHDVEGAPGGLAPPSGWMHKNYKVGPITLARYASPPVQLVLVAFVCFLCPGMFNSLSGLGGGGQIDAIAADDAAVALYSAFSVVAFFGGSLVNRVGIKYTLSFGGFGYFIYTCSFLSYNHNQNYGFVIFAGALLGVCAGCLWAAQGTIMMSYPHEGSKGKYISWFWMIFNLGGVIGSLIPLGQNINNTSSGAVNDGTYIGFMVLMFLGGCLALCLADAGSIIRSDGSRVILMKNPTWQSEIYGLWEVLRSDFYIVALFPMFLASNWFYAYQFNDVNQAQFNVRTRALNSLLYWSSQIFGALIFGYALDLKTVSRSMRAKGCWVAIFAVTMAIWGGGYAFQITYNRPESEAKGYVKMDWTTPGYVGPMFLYMFYGFYDAAWQTYVYWIMGALTNNSRKLANFTGFYKGIQSAGSVITFRINSLSTPYMNEFASNWGLLLFGLFAAAPVILMKIRDTIPLEEDLKFSDETVEDVIGIDRDVDAVR